MAVPRADPESSETFCSICLDKFSDRVDTPCGHAFCCECIVAVCRTNPPSFWAPCPFCRRSIFVQDLMRDGMPAFPPEFEEGIAREEVMVDGENIWHRDLIVLSATPTIIRYDFMPIDTESEVIGAFSLNCHNWGDGDCDAVSWYAASHRSDFSFRGEMFEYCPPNLAQRSPTRVRAGEWHSMEVALSLSEATYRVDGEEFGRVLRQSDGAGALYPDRGYLGMIRYDSRWKYRNLHVMRSERFFSHLDTRKWEVIWPTWDTRARIQLRYGRFAVFGREYQLQNTTPVSFTWADGTTQCVQSFDGQRIAWRTDNQEHPVIFWDLIEEHGEDQHPFGAEAASNSVRTMRLMRAVLESEAAVEAEQRRNRRRRCSIS